MSRGRKRKVIAALDDLESAQIESKQLKNSKREGSIAEIEFPRQLELVPYNDSVLPSPANDDASKDSITSDLTIGEMVVGQALNLIPSTFKESRITLVATILKFVEGYSNCTIEDVKTMVNKVNTVHASNSLKYFGFPTDELLWSVTLGTRKPHMRFLGPPTEKCFKCSRSLQSHNAISEVICFDMKAGPLPSQKTTLRCCNCGINYR